MLSILIPIYNFEVFSLIKELNKQCIACQIEFEILGFDDGSKNQFKNANRAIRQYPGVLYKELPQNLGRSKIRNTLANHAKFPSLLFIDCDSKIVNKQYIKKYILEINPTTIVYGGRIYGKLPPSDNQKNLHYFYGKNREEILTEERKILNYQKFMTNNFLIPKAIFITTKFEESVIGYGHEDTLFGLNLQRQNIPIKHINNPLEHIGLEDSGIFLEKQKEAIKNLYKLFQKGLRVETKLLSTFIFLKKLNIERLILIILSLLLPIIKRNLGSKKPNLLFLDLFKLQYLLSIANRKK